MGPSIKDDINFFRGCELRRVYFFFKFDEQDGAPMPKLEMDYRSKNLSNIAKKFVKKNSSKSSFKKLKICQKNLPKNLPKTFFKKIAKKNHQKFVKKSVKKIKDPSKNSSKKFVKNLSKNSSKLPIWGRKLSKDRKMYFMDGPLPAFSTQKTETGTK